MTTTYAPLFDDAELSELARQMPVEPAWIEYQRQAIRHPDIATRIIHDRQFMDLSERYDPVEPTDDAIADVSRRDRRAIWAAVAAVVALQLVTVAVALIW